ncbi:hypothetical protein HN51_047274 [Arachis hypogaea]
MSKFIRSQECQKTVVQPTLHKFSPSNDSDNHANDVNLKEIFKPNASLRRSSELDLNSNTGIYIGKKGTSSFVLPRHSCGPKVPQWMPVSFRPPEDMILTTDEVACAAYIFGPDLKWQVNRDEVLVSTRTAYANRESLATLVPGEQVIQDVIDSLTCILTQEHKKLNKLPSIWFLPTTFSVKGRLEGGQLYTPAYVARMNAMVRGAARGITVPTNLTVLWSSLQQLLQEMGGTGGVAVDESFFQSLFNGLVKEGEIQGSVRAGVHWTPAVVLHRHLLRTVAAPMVDMLLHDLDEQNKLKNGVELQESPSSESISVSPGDRVAIVRIRCYLHQRLYCFCVCC